MDASILASLGVKTSSAAADAEAVLNSRTADSAPSLLAAGLPPGGAPVLRSFFPPAAFAPSAAARASLIPHLRPLLPYPSAPSLSRNVPLLRAELSSVRSGLTQARPVSRRSDVLRMKEQALLALLNACLPEPRADRLHNDVDAAGDAADTAGLTDAHWRAELGRRQAERERAARRGSGAGGDALAVPTKRQARPAAAPGGKRARAQAPAPPASFPDRRGGGGGGAPPPP
ncbi:hypothetical protein TeGR_g4575, partial [Tetraparma gracilis]